MSENVIVLPGEQDSLPAGPVTPKQNPLVVLHRLLRGRYVFAVIAIIIGVVCGATIGWKIKRPLYSSTAVIRVKPVIPKVLYQNENNGALPMFDAFLETQLSLITNQRLLDLAMQDPQWKALGRGLDPEQVVDFNKNVVATHPGGSELIAVTFTDPDPAAARIGVESIVDAYDHLYGEGDSSVAVTQLKALDDLRVRYEADYKRWKDRVAAVATEVGSGPDLDFLMRMHRSKRDQVAQLETELRNASIAVALSSGQNRRTTTQPTTQATEEINSMSVAELAAQYKPLSDLLIEREQQRSRLFSETLRLGSRNQLILDQQQMAAETDRRIEETAGIVRSSLLAAACRPVALGGKSYEQLKADEQNIQALYDRMKAEADALGRKSTEMKQYQDEADAADAMLKEVKARIEQLSIESGVGGRISIENKGDQPLEPSKDQRKQFAAVGGIGFGGFLFSLVVLRGFLDRRVQTVSDVRQGSLNKCRLLGVLPLLPRDLSDPEQAIVAAHAVHHIRATLQHRHHALPTPIFSVMSSSPGSGKTSLVAALGLSFVTSGAKVLMIDCDIIGGGLTAMMKTVARRRLGSILRRAGLVTAEQVRASVKYAQHHRVRIGEALIALGHIRQGELDAALKEQEESALGLHEAMHGEPAMECVASLGTPGLFIMPLGSAKRQHASHLSYAGLLKILEQVKPHFDVIIIDTGPVLGSLEASVVAMAADEIVLTVTRGEQRPQFAEAYERLTTAGGKVAGVVLNRADATEIRSSGFSVSVGRHSTRASTESGSDLPLAPAKVFEHEYLSLGPIGSAVAALSGLEAKGAMS